MKSLLTVLSAVALTAHGGAMSLLAADSILSGTAPGNSSTNYAIYEPALAKLENGTLILKEQQFATPGTESYGAGTENSTATGYGAYQFDGRVLGGDDTGYVAAGFLYLNGSQTEIDVELWGGRVYFTNWTSEHAKRQSSAPLDVKTWHTYRFTWKPSEIDYFIDNRLVAIHHLEVPSKPAHFFFTMRGTNGLWGGRASPGTAATFEVRNSSYFPR